MMRLRLAPWTDSQAEGIHRIGDVLVIGVEPLSRFQHAGESILPFQFLQHHTDVEDEFDAIADMRSEFVERACSRVERAGLHLLHHLTQRPAHGQVVPRIRLRPWPQSVRHWRHI